MLYKRSLPSDFKRAKKAMPEAPVVVSEGDSWFTRSNVVGHLDDPLGNGSQRAWALLRLEKSGDEIMTILSGSQRSRLRKLFKEGPVHALLLSAGANDILGPDLLPLLREAPGAEAPEAFLEPTRLARRLRQIQDCYRELLDMLADAGREQTKVFANSYDYVTKFGDAVEAFGIFKVAGPWLLPHLQARLVPPGLHAGVVKLLADAFVRAIDEIAAEYPGRLVRVETRNLVGADWKDEIHPNRQGARSVAEAFEKALRAEGIIA